MGVGGGQEPLMGRYIIRRLIQAIPLLFIISVIVFVLAVKMGDPLATFGGRSMIKSQDRIRLTRQLGLDKPLYVQYIVWLVGNDWMKIDLDGDKIPETYGTRKGVLRGDLGTSFVTKQPVTTDDRRADAQYAAAHGDQRDRRLDRRADRGPDLGAQAIFDLRSHGHGAFVHRLLDAHPASGARIDVHFRHLL